MLLLAIMYNYDSILKHKWIYKRCNNCEVISVNIKNMASAFFDSFRSTHVILYVGQNISDDDLQEYIAKCPWSCVITSRRDSKFSELFSDEDRKIFQYNSRSEIPVKPLHRKKLPIMRLFGVEGQKKEEEEEELSWLKSDLSEDSDSDYDMSQAKEFLQFLPELLDHVNPLVVVGIDSDIDWKILDNTLNKLLYTKATDGSVSFWGVPETVEPKYTSVLKVLHDLCEKKNFSIYTNSLAEIIHQREAEFDSVMDDEDAAPELDNDIYYQGQKATSITQSDFLLFKNVGTLLTERTINRIHPLGRIMSRTWFSNFLESSASLGPQWYGYLPQSTFYVKRSYEDALVQLVRKMLDGRSITGSSSVNRPIILAGDPGSSKSITLGALAYRIFNEKIHPVIYISKDSFLSANIGTGFDELDEAMQLLENKCDVATRILVIWDSSAYRAGMERAQALMERLQNRGRSFVLVCSSYSIYSGKEEGENGCYYLSDSQSGKFVPCSEDQAQVYDRSNCYFVKAIREMNGKEKYDFWQRAKEYSGINESTLSYFRKKLLDEGRDEIFDYYYLLISVLRENLERGLQSEQSKVYPYVEKELQKAIGEIYTEDKVEKKRSPIYQALLKAGIDPALMERAEDDIPDSEELDKKLDLFNMCVAMFSRFKLAVPYSLVYTLLLGDNSEDQYSESSMHLYKIVTSEIPWIHYGEDEDGNFSFRFRNPLEADIFLRNHDCTGEQQVKLLCDIIDIYGSDYRKSRCKDLTFTDNLQALLRLIGPNSSYPPFRTSQNYDHESILKKLDILIERLEEIQHDYGVPDDDAGFATIIVTFIREYYGSIWNRMYAPNISEEAKRWEHDPLHFAEESYKYRISQLVKAITLAEQSLEDLNQKVHGQDAKFYGVQHLMNQRYSLSVEIAQCNMRLEEIIDAYKCYCQAYGNTPDPEYSKRKLSYRILYNQLLPVITSNPTNGYAYNALFKAFEWMYEKENLSEARKLQHLSEIMQVVETCETMDREIVNRGGREKDELTDHINRIKDLSTGFQITLQSIRRHRNGEPPENENQKMCFTLYDEMLEANNAAAITFICQKELRIPKGTRKLNTDQLTRCSTVYNFMKEADNFECICSNAYALAMMIRVVWMLYNKTTLTSSPECQLTHLDHKQWVELNKLCSMYNELAGDNKQPLIILIFALSTLQINDLSEGGFQAAFDILETIDESMFYQRRMWTPFMLCDANGVPYEFTGTVLSTKGINGFIRVNGVPLRMRNDVGVRFRQYNLGKRIEMPAPNQFLEGLELGLGYTSLSVYTAAGRRDRGMRI